MALNIKKVNAYDVGASILAQTSVDKGLMTKLFEAGFGVKIGDDNFQFWWKGTADEPESLMDTVKFNDFGLLKEGKLSAGIMHALSTLLTNKINHFLGTQNSAMAMLPKKKPKAGVFAGDDEEEVAAPAKTSKSKSGNAQATFAMWPMFEGDIENEPRVKLIKAKTMYQPVSATSGGSRYFLIGGCDELKLACRYKKGNLSLRVEGTGLDDYTQQLKMCGFNNNGDYASVHLHPPMEDPTMDRKTIGAVLFAIGAPWRTPLPDLEFIKNKGA